MSEAEQLKQVEQKLGATLPEALRQIYQNPGKNQLPKLPLSLKYAMDLYESLQKDLEHKDASPTNPSPSTDWPDKLFPFYHWGCGIYSCVDCSKETYPVIVFDQWMLYSHKATFAEWLADMRSGKNVWEEMCSTLSDPIYLEPSED